MTHFNISGQTAIPGGEIHFNIDGDVELPNNELCRAAGYAAVGAATTLAVLYGWPHFKPLIEDAVTEALNGVNQAIRRIFTGSLHVWLECFTAERFLEVLADYESGKIKQRLKKEFSDLGLKVKELKVEIENTEEVNKRKEAIDIERHKFCMHIHVNGI